MQIQNDSIQIVKQPYELLTGENAEKCTAVRHANGRDWWVMFQSFGAGTGAPYKQFLLVEDNLYFARTIATNNQNDNLFLGTMGQSGFSANGKFYAAVQQTGQLHLFNFHRHKGLLSKQNTFWFNPQPYGMAFLDSFCIVTCNRENPDLNSVNGLNCFTYQVDTLYYESYSGRSDSIFGAIGSVGENIIGVRPRGYNLLKINKNWSLDTTFYTNLPYVVRGNPPNLPNYELGPDLNPGYTTSLSDTVLCVGQTFTVTDTSWGHFRRKWEWGDGTFSDTLPVKQHWELLGLTDTFRILSHTFSQPGTYNLTLHIINDSSEFGYMDSSVSKTFVVLPWCQSPQIQTHTDTTCLGQMAFSASGDSATYLWTFTNDTVSGQNIVHSFTQAGWNVFTLKVSKLGVDTLLTDSVFVKDCITANLITEMIPFCDSVIIKVYPQIIQGQIDNASVTFQNQTVSCLDSCTFTSAPLSEQTEALEVHFQNSTYDTTFSKSLVIKKLDCPEFIEIFPNPITNTLNIHYRLEQPENLRLCNAIGQDVLHLHLEGNGIYSVDVTALARGFYHLRLEKHPSRERGLRESWKIVLIP